MKNDKALAVKEETALATATELGMDKQEALALSAEMGISASDLVLPRILLAQAGSPFNVDANSKTGDIVRNDTYTVIADTKKAVEIVPLRMWKTWAEYKRVSATEKEFVRMYDVTPANERQGFKGLDQDGVEVERDYRINVFCVLRAELTSDVPMLPMIVVFKRTSLQAGRAVATHFQRLLAYGRKHYGHSMLLQSAMPAVEKGKSPYAVFVARTGSALTAQELSVCDSMFKLTGSLVKKAEAQTLDEAPEVSATVNVEYGNVAPSDLI